MKKVLCYMTAIAMLLCGCESADVKNETSFVSSESTSFEKESEFNLQTEKETEKKTEKPSKKEPEKKNEAVSVEYTSATQKEIEYPREESSDMPWEVETDSFYEEITVVPYRRVALTFDDGPSIYTEQILDILKQYGCKATFFTVGNRLDKNADALKRAFSEGHEIGCHTWSHKRLVGEDKDVIDNEISMTTEKIFDLTGGAVNLVRPPYGAWDDDLKEIGKEMGVAFVNWSVDTLDWKTRDESVVYDEILKSTKDGAIILCHDLYQSTVDAVSRAVPELLKEGYELVTVSELIGENEIEPGWVYYNRSYKR